MTEKTYAAFDFDGTMTYRDSLLSFLYFLNGSKMYWKLAAELPHLAGYLIGNQSRQDIKERILTAFFAGKPYEEMSAQGAAFVKTASSLLRPRALERLRWHQQRGDECILVSANLDIYLHAWAKELGFTHAVTSTCAVDAQGLLTGKLQGLNCWGPEKVDRLKVLLPARDHYQLYAYGDSPGDHALLAHADYAFYRYFHTQTI